MSTAEIPDMNNRGRIAKIVLIFVLSCVGAIIIGGSVLVGLLIHNVKPIEPDKLIGYFKDIVSMILPLLGTWIGTVLAYYFAKENFESANKSVRDLVSIVSPDQKLKSLKVSDPKIMIAAEKIKYYLYTKPEDMARVKVVDMLKDYETKSVLRLPFLDGSMLIKYCIHRSIFDKYISKTAIAVPPADITTLTFDSFLNTNLDDIKSYVHSGFALIGESSTLYDAKLIMDSNKYIADIFITKTGKTDEPVIGWITDTLIMENSRA